MRRFALLVPVLLAAAVAAQAQAPSPVHQAELKKLDFLKGKWKGKASITGREGTQVLTQTEDVEYRLGGTVLLVEGRGTGAAPGKGDDALLFNAFAVISYDATAKKFRIRAHRMEGTAVDADLVLTEKGFNWGFKPPGGKVEVRYVMAITDRGEWNETGEYSLDGKKWTKFIDMTLTRVKE
jgi:hypothetical protein